MKYLAKKLELPGMINYKALQLKSVSSHTINKYTKAIVRQCNQLDNEIIKQLKDEQLWQRLNTNSIHHVEVLALFNLWRKIEPLAHLNTKQLQLLLEENVFPLERSYQHLIFQFPKKAVVSQANINLARIKNLKKIIYSSLYVRCKAHKMLKAPRNVDDILSAICHQVNRLNILEKRLILNSPLTATCDDDRRVAIHDLLKMAKYQIVELDDVITPIPLQTNALPTIDKDNQLQFKKMNQFRNKQVQAMNLDGFAEQIFILTQNKKTQYSLMQLLVKKSSNKLSQWFFRLGLMSLSQKLYHFRYAFYFMVSLLCYLILFFALAPIVAPFAAWLSVETLSSVLFYTAGLLPFWILSFKSVKNLCSHLIDYLTCWKKQEVLDGLIAIENAQHFICDKLCHYIIDVSHCDVHEMSLRAKKHQNHLAVILLKLNRFSLWEKWFFPSSMLSIIHRMNKKIRSQEKQFKSVLKKMAMHIALRVGQDISLLDVSLNNKGLIPIISLNQLKRLRSFIIQHGDQKALNLFDKNTQLEEKWIDKIEKNQFLHVCPIHSQLKFPWGGYDLHLHALKGWQTLLQIFTHDPNKRNALFKLNRLLMGKQVLNSQDFDTLINQLGCAKTRERMKSQIQLFIFKTLPIRDPIQAQLLSPRQKEEIVNIYLKQKNDIDKANLFVAKLFKAKKSRAKILFGQATLIGNIKIRRYFELLDLQIMYYHAIGEPSIACARQNQFRDYFKAYQGEDGFAYQLIEFLPRKEQPDFIVAVAKKRVSWILHHISLKENKHWEFSPIDMALLNDYQLHHNNRFDFTQIVIDSPIFNRPWSRHVAHFLKSCRHYGLDSGELYTRYQAKVSHRDSSKPILVQHHLNKMQNALLSKTATNNTILIKNRNRCHA